MLELRKQVMVKFKSKEYAQWYLKIFLEGRAGRLYGTLFAFRFQVKLPETTASAALPVFELSAIWETLNSELD